MSKKGRDFILFIEDILEAINKIETYTQGMSFQEFCTNSMAIDAVIRNFEVIGEAAANIPEKITEKYTDCEWKEAIGFRNILIHNYFGIDIEAVWDTLMNNIQPLKRHIKEVLEREKELEG